MIHVITLSLITILLTFSFETTSRVEPSPSDGDSLRLPGEKHLKNIRQLTDGGENAEAYLSFDEKYLTFQSTIEPYHCDQIFTMTLDGKNVRRISNGKGRTTCAYWFPNGKTLLYSSTFRAADDCLEPPDRSKGYVWKLYPEFNIYAVDKNGKNTRVLFESPGYDAEATVSPRGDRIVFTSTKDGDPEIYTMDLKGKNVKRLTNTKGYDGGPFYSLDGQKIVYRANHPEGEKELAAYSELVKDNLVRPTRLEIFVMNADGSGQTQITRNGKANFAPFFHPDGKRIIFCSNVNDPKGRNFDLYMINIDGTGLERITDNETFDGFPMFTRDGKKLVFCSNRHNKKQGETNVFIADWID